eukprot:6184567-Pleurochrysis_carterae.AAC.2
MVRLVEATAPKWWRPQLCMPFSRRAGAEEFSNACMHASVPVNSLHVPYKLIFSFFERQQCAALVLHVNCDPRALELAAHVNC